MAYTKIGWVNDRAPAINQGNLNHMDQGIYDAHRKLSEYEDVFTGDVGESVQNWLDEHPEATTTVEDGAITEPKLASSLADKIIYNRAIFMPVAYDSNGTNSDCTVIITYKGHTIMFDTGYPLSYNLIKQELANNEVETIDYLIVSHYHGDHYGNITSLVADGYLTSDSYVYLPKIGASSSIAAIEADVMSLLNNNSIPYSKPDTGYELDVDNINISFFNCNQDDADYYDTVTSDYNNYSTCNLIKCGVNTFGFFGDIGMAAQTRIYESGILEKLDIMKLPHHGNDESGNVNFMLSTMPDCAIAMQTLYMLRERLYKGFAYNLLSSYGCGIYSAGNGTIKLNFSDGDYYLEPNSSSLYGGGAINITLYVDASYTGKSDGSINKPFPTVSSALSYAKKFKGINVTITPVSSYVSNEELDIRYTGNSISLSNLTLKRINASNGCVLALPNVTLTGDGDALVCSSAVIRGGNLTISGEGNRGLVLYNSKASFESLSISNKSTAIANLNGSTLYVVELQGSNNSYVINANNGSITFVGTSTMTYTNAIYANGKNVYGAIGEFVRSLSDIKTSAVLDENGIQITRKNGYSVLTINSAVTLSSGDTELTTALPTDVRLATPQRVPLMGRSGGTHGTATYYIGALFVDNANKVHAVFGTNYQNVNYITVDAILSNKA